MPNDFLEKLHAATSTPVSTEGGLDGHPDSLTPLGDLMTDEDGLGRAIYAAGRNSLATSYSTATEIERTVKAVTVQAPTKKQMVEGVLKEVAVPFQGSDGHLHYTRVDPQHTLALRDAVSSAFSRAAKRIDAYSAIVQDGIAQMNKAINRSIETAPTAADDVITASEIRAYCSKLDPKARVGFVKNLIDDEDLAGARAILGKGNAYLSGLNRGEHGALRQLAEEKFNSKLYKQRDAALRILSATDAAGAKLLGRAANILNGPAKVQPSKPGDAIAKLKSG